jgi:hypothetical protein
VFHCCSFSQYSVTLTYRIETSLCLTSVSCIVFHYCIGHIVTYPNAFLDILTGLLIIHVNSCCSLVARLLMLFYIQTKIEHNKMCTSSDNEHTDTCQLAMYSRQCRLDGKHEYRTITLREREEADKEMPTWIEWMLTCRWRYVIVIRLETIFEW